MFQAHNVNIMTIANKEVTIYSAHDTGSPLVILNSFGDEGEAVHEELQKMQKAVQLYKRSADLSSVS